MSTTTINDQYIETARLSIHEIVRRLNDVLGPTLVSTIAGSTDRKAAIRWAKAESGRITPAFETRLRLAYRAMTAIASAENVHVVRAWFISANPLLDEDTPIAAIRDDRHRDVVRAFTTLIGGDWTG